MSSLRCGVVTACLLLFDFVLFGTAKVQFYVEKFEYITLPKLMAEPIEQNLTFQYAKSVLAFKLIPTSSILTRDTRIQFIAGSKDGKHVNTTLDAENFSQWKFDGFMIDTPANIISGTVNRYGGFEGFFIYRDEVFFLQLRNTSQRTNTNEKLLHKNNTIIFKISEICRRPLKDNNGKIKNCRSPYENLIKVCNEDEPNSTDGPIELSVLGEMAMESNLSRRDASTANTHLCNLKVVLDYRYFKYVAKNDKDLAVSTAVSLLTRVDKIFRNIDFNEDGVADNIGFYIDDIAVYKDPVRASYTESTAWDPIKFFQEMREYDFSGACVGLLFTFREMQSAEDKTPSLIKTQLINEQQGICSELRVSVPKTSMNDYGEFIANALPINFRLNGHQACEYTMVVQLLHQLGHLFGAPDDDFYGEDDACCTKMRGHTYAMAFPAPPGDKDEHSTYSSCSIMAMANFLSKSTRPCLRICEGSQCNHPLLGMKPIGRIVVKNYTSKPPTTLAEISPTRDWTEYCFTVPRNEALNVNYGFYDIFIYFVAVLLTLID
ncbi:hypothetical protein CHUAL_013698 [Chamberlinius hualienensis]